MTDARQRGEPATNPPTNANRSKGSVLGPYRMEFAAIPEDIRKTVADKVGGNIDVWPAKENGSYKGPVVHADQNYIVQAVGLRRETAVIHQRNDLNMQGPMLLQRDSRNDLENRNLQVHYTGSSAKVYMWDAEKEAQQRAARAAAKEADRSTSSASKVMSEAEKYAAENIKNAKQREAFLKHLGNVTQQAFQPQQRQEQAAKEQAKPVPSQTKQADHGIER
ncbi:TPA: hypothetical protein NH725_005181 [Pseudomonas aeruginosa]|uniref:KfrB domain-containing protein n=1 Tax=Citrobacter TaxID=544 RepID=UPI0008F81324|nr:MULTISPECIES: hypothetical protein [Citrobacter]OIK39846.1 hypothetical protein BED30_24015 [Citrobacter portucalensis]HCF0934682.1 hypothetical protein [Pseudomonas aeruginosa]